MPVQYDTDVYFREKTLDPVGQLFSGFSQAMSMRDQIENRRTKQMQNDMLKDKMKSQKIGKVFMGMKGGEDAYQTGLKDLRALGYKGEDPRVEDLDEKILGTMNFQDQLTFKDRQITQRIGMKKAGLMRDESGKVVDDPNFIDTAKDIRDMRLSLMGGQLAEQQLKAPRHAEKLRLKAVKNKFETTQKLRKERSSLPTTKATAEVSSAYNKVQAAAKKPSAAGDLALIFNYMKILDPGSVVRESEFRSAAQARAWLTKSESTGLVIPGFIKQGIQKLESGQFLLPEQRADFVNKAGEVYQSQLDVQRNVDKQFNSLARQYGINPRDVLLEFKANVPRPKANKKKKKTKASAEAVNWARKNRKDPRASRILKMYGLEK